MIVSNSTPLINFAAIQRLDILEHLFGKLFIPNAVKIELTEKGDLYPSTAEIKKATFIEVKKILDTMLANSLRLDLDPGEAEAIALALEYNADLLLLDEIAGRKIAELHGIPFMGTIGCLVEAKNIGIIQKIKPLLESIQIEARFWLSEKLFERILKDNGE
jgi:hypothetical protein